jgi:NhaP-type Na+/H+ or K+/H+ antiporter
MSIDSSTLDWYSSSSTGGGESEDDKEVFLAGSTALAAGVLVICVSIAYYVKMKKWYWIPESVVSMVIGGLCGAVILAFRKGDASKLIFDPQIFFFVLLPPIIFNAGYNMKRRNFFKYFSAIMVFAVPGTMVAITTVAFALYYISQWGALGIGNLTLVDSFIFATVG